MCWDGPCTPIPGSTRADLTSQARAQKGMFESARYYAPGCKDLKVIDTQYKSIAKYNWWEEVWTIDACGRKFQNTISFRNDGSVSSSVGLTEIK